MRIDTLQVTNVRSFENTDHLKLGRITLIVGPNNSGKSALINSLLHLQYPVLQSEDLRFGASGGGVMLTVSGGDIREFLVPKDAGRPLQNAGTGAVIVCQLNDRGGPAWHFKRDKEDQVLLQIPGESPKNFLVPFLSGRKVRTLEENVGKQNAKALRLDLSNIVPKVDVLMNRDHSGHDAFRQACESILGFGITTDHSQHGKAAGLLIADERIIPLQSMGSGTLQIVGLLADLVEQRPRLFLIEEPENDVHPGALIKLLNLIAANDKSQFVISTHSNIVVQTLGREPDTIIWRTQMTLKEKVPTSTVSLAANDIVSRWEILRELGYSMADYDMWEGWLLLEESSAEAIIAHLIRWFCPKLTGRLRTVSAAGVHNLGGTLRAYETLLVYLHLTGSFRDRAWVFADGDAEGRKVIEAIRRDFPTWNLDNFQTFDQEAFERYYPEEFQSKAQGALALTGDAKRNEKKRLLKEVLGWVGEDDSRARQAFERSAAPVIRLLKGIEVVLGAS